MTDLRQEWKEWIPADCVPDDTFRGVNAPTVYGCREPRELIFRRYLARYSGRAIRNDPIVLHPDHYAWLERELRGENE